VPGSVLVRGALGDGHDPGAIRAAVGVCFWVMERARSVEHGGRLWWQRAVAVPASRIAAEMGVGAAEVVGGLAALGAAEVLVPGDHDRMCLQAEVLCEHPALAAIQWGAVRKAIRAHGGRLGPALAVLREVVRLGPSERRGGGAVLRLTELVEATLYGRSAVSQALAELEVVGMLERLESGGRRALHLGPGRSAFEANISSAVPDRVGPHASGNAGLTVPAGTPLRFAGAPALPAPDGLIVEIGDGVRIRVEKDADGQDVCRVGPLVIGPL